MRGTRRIAPTNLLRCTRADNSTIARYLDADRGVLDDLPVAHAQGDGRPACASSGPIVRNRLQGAYFLDPERGRRKSFITRPRYSKGPGNRAFFFEPPT